MVLTLNEPVQATSLNSAEITIRNAAVTPPATDPNEYKVGCRQLENNGVWFGKAVIVPVKNAHLTPNALHKITVPSACFRDLTPSDGQHNTPQSADTFTTEPADQCGTLPPVRLSGSKPAPTTLPLSPARDEWLTDAGTSYIMYFSEPVQKGLGFITISKTSGEFPSTVVDSFLADQPKALVGQGGFPGKLEIPNSGSAWFQPGAEYSLKIGLGALRGRTGSFVSAQFQQASGVQGPYKVKVTTELVPNTGLFPRPDGSKGFTPNHRLVLEFKHAVIPHPGTDITNKMFICRQWEPDNACKNSGQIATTDMMFLGKKVIVNPDPVGLISGGSYNVSIPDSVFQYYKGMSADVARKWHWSFSVDDDTKAKDEGAPELVDLFVDCDGNGKLIDTSSSYSEGCDTDSDSAHDFYELRSALSTDGLTPVPVSSQFKLYFNEKN